MNSNILVLCDKEEEYAHHMSEYLKAQKEVPWKIHTYTDAESLKEFALSTPIELLVVAESIYTEDMKNLSSAKVILLNESGVIRWDNIRNVNKYQRAENVYKEILSEYMEVTPKVLPRLSEESHTRLIGFFTPVHRSLQTTFALTMGQMLAGKYKTLYLSFEFCAGNGELLSDVRTKDLADLVYFLNTDKERFLLRMQTIIMKKGQMDYVPPARAGFMLPCIRTEEWLELLGQIIQSGEYDYVILDLSESIQGLLEILRMCYKIFTLLGDDRFARGKLAQYERLLALSEYEDVLSKTSRYKPSRFRKIPEEIELLTKSDIADYVRRIVGEVTF